jgi:hypothetical protein
MPVTVGAPLTACGAATVAVFAGPAELSPALEFAAQPANSTSTIAMCNLIRCEIGMETPLPFRVPELQLRAATRIDLAGEPASCKSLAAAASYYVRCHSTLRRRHRGWRLSPRDESMFRCTEYNSIQCNVGPSAIVVNARGAWANSTLGPSLSSISDQRLPADSARARSAPDHGRRRVPDDTRRRVAGRN